MKYSMTIWYNENNPDWYKSGINENLRLIKNAGFTHINWNPDAGSSYIYSIAEMEHINEMVKNNGLEVKTLHAAHGHHYVMEIKSPFMDRRKDITSSLSWIRQAGIELVENRIMLSKILNCKNMVLHIPFVEDALSKENRKEFLGNLFIALDKIRPFAEKNGICIAIENLHNTKEKTKVLFEALFERYPKEYIGWCYDSGHAMNNGLSFEDMDLFKDRLVAMHLHDNFGAKDDHLIPGDGQIDWDKAVNLIAKSAYELPLNFETPPGRYSVNMESFYERAFESIKNLTDRVVQARKSLNEDRA